jgi:hypothetical protein
VSLRRAVAAAARAARPYPYELWTVGGALATIALLRSRGLDYGWNTIEHTFPSLLAALPRLFALGLVLNLVAARLAGERPGDYLRGVATVRWAALWARLWLMAAVQIYAYMWLKVSIPLVNERLWDGELWRLDRWLHFGYSPTVLAIELVAGTPLARAFDVLYGAWIPSIPLVFAYVFAWRREAPRRNLALASAALWTLGAWIYFALPAVGPCYASPDVVRPIAAEMPTAAATQRALWRNYRGMVASRGGQPDHFQPMYGVAALPSLHVGAYVLFALWSRRHARRWQTFWWVAAGLVFFGSLATGWHYAVDGYAGALLAWLAIRIADRWEPVEDSIEDKRSGAPGTKATGRETAGHSERSGGGSPSSSASSD